MRIVLRILKLRSRAQTWIGRKSAEMAVARFPRIKVKRAHELPGRLVVSLTSYPSRFQTLAKTIKSLLDQKVAAERTILWIAHDDMALIPEDVLKLKDHGLAIMSCEDLGPHTKLVPALQNYPDAFIVTADDDTYYAPDWLDALVSQSKLHPGTIVAHRCHFAYFAGAGTFSSYSDWEMETDRVVDSVKGQIFPTGVGGVLYPPGALDSRAVDSSAFRRLCARADDIWFFMMGRLKGTPRRGLGEPFPLINWKGTQESGLLHTNWLGGENDLQLRAVENWLTH